MRQGLRHECMTLSNIVDDHLIDDQLCVDWTMELTTEDTDDFQNANVPSLDASSAHQIVTDPETLRFGEFSPVEKASTPLPSHQPSPTVMTAAIEGSAIPSTAKRVLLRFERALPSPPPYPLETIDASSSSLPSGTSIVNGMMEQTRSMTLIQKLRQSSFRRKMNPSIDTLSASFTFPTDHSVTPSLRTNDTVAWNEETEALPHTLVVGRLERGGSLEILSPRSVERNDKEDGVIKSPRVSSTGGDSEMPIHSPLLPSSSAEEQVDHNQSENRIQAYSLLTDSIPPTQSRLDHFAHSTHELGASSMAFMQQIRGAAFRRKKNLTRSRDTFLEKERLHRQSIAQASEVARLQTEAALESQRHAQRSKDTISLPHLSLVKPFKALPLPITTGYLGSGGLYGVPKVPKRQPTIPKSPFLGPRRLLAADSANRLELPPRAASATSSQESSSFKALPLPKSSLLVGGAGQSGVPKVPKRKVTIPKSPLLGPFRRLPPVEASANENAPIANDDDVSHSKELLSDDGGSSILMGTDFHPIDSSKENEDPVAMVPRPSLAYIPHSTRRAEQRAAFEIERAKNEQLRREAERKERLQQVQMLQKELDVLRIEI